MSFSMENGELNQSNSEDDDCEPMTSAELVSKLQQTWLNEKHAPDILEHKTEYVECTFELIHQMEENIKNQPPGDFRIVVHKIEIDRIRYIMNNYLRCRFEKIQKNTSYVLQKHKEMEPDRILLAPGELEFANEYLTSIHHHLETLALQHLPGNLRSFNLHDTMPRPQTNHFVFFKALEDVSDVLIDEDTVGNKESVIDLRINSQHLTKYKTIEHLVRSGAVYLI